MRFLGAVAASLLLAACAGRQDAVEPAEAQTVPGGIPGRTDAGIRFDEARAASKQAMAEGRPEAAEAHALGAVTAAHQLGDDDPRFAVALSELAALYVMQGRYEAAKPPARQAAEVYERTLGPAHDDTLLALENYASVLEALGETSDAESVRERARAVRDLR